MAEAAAGRGRHDRKFLWGNLFTVMAPFFDYQVIFYLFPAELQLFFGCPIFQSFGIALVRKIVWHYGIRHISSVEEKLFLIDAAEYNLKWSWLVSWIWKESSYTIGFTKRDGFVLTKSTLTVWLKRFSIVSSTTNCRFGRFITILFAFCLLKAWKINQIWEPNICTVNKCGSIEFKLILLKPLYSHLYINVLV